LTRRIETDGPGGLRRIDPAEFPLAIGGPDSELILPEIHGTEPLLHLGLDDEAIFAQPSDTASGGPDPVICNGSELTTSQWLRDGDVIGVGRARIEFHENDERILIRVAGPSRDTKTEPPELVAPPPRSDEPIAPAYVRPVKFRPATAEGSRRNRLRIRPMLFVQIAVFTALAAGAWFVFTARSVTVDIDPPPDRVALHDGLPAIKIGTRFFARPGRYTLVAELEGYRRLETEVEITRKTGQVLGYRLDRLPGTLVITCPQVAGAAVIVDGRPAGVTPVEDLELAAGDHEVWVSADRFQDFVATINIQGPGSVETLEVQLKPDWAPITFGSIPSGAQVQVDGDNVGRTPLTAEIASGGHSLLFYQDGYKPRRSRLEVVANQPQTLDPVKLVRSDGNLGLSSEPSEASVTVDAEFRGRTPLDLELTPDEVHTLQLSKAGYETTEREVRLTSGTSSTINVELEPRYGDVEITSSPPNAKLYVDGEARGNTGTVVELIALPHTIEVRKDGFESFQTTITPRPGIRQTVQATLKATGGPVQLAQTIQSPQGVELRLIPPGRFTMGASRREPGRRANETLREIELTRPFYMAVREVSNREFREFYSEHRSGAAGSKSLEIDHHPVVSVTWQQAARFCNWLSEKEGLAPVYVDRSGTLVARSPLPYGYRLPTEAEWAWAARVPDGSTVLKYPWGDSLPVPPDSGNYGDRSADEMLGGSIPNYNDSHPATAPVGSFEPNSRGLFNLGGNVSEWVHDVYTIFPPAEGKVDTDPMGPREGEYHVIRGASWMDESVTELRLSYRDYGDDPRPDVGFRIARSVAAAE